MKIAMDRIIGQVDQTMPLSGGLVDPVIGASIICGSKDNIGAGEVLLSKGIPDPLHLSPPGKAKQRTAERRSDYANARATVKQAGDPLFGDLSASDDHTALPREIQAYGK